ncbi:Translin-associated factor X-interacting protein 1 [Cichlidogyrus casuarinus]|uniref:Translin-associated factor X-interacting protein 1 n=1 Tax=Cichlidogyrus casuarinus TaxID=1844966 RepID=A0ABD2Q5A3_9PLAT
MKANKVKTLSTWPSHASSHVTDTIIASREVNRMQIVRHRDYHVNNPKPMFLVHIESKINNQIKLFGVLESMKPSDTRLNVYGPILARIKHEYDAFIENGAKELKEALYFRDYVNVLVEKYEHRVAEAYKSDYEMIQNLEDEIQRLRGKISLKNDEIRHFEEICEHLKNELASEAEKFHHASDARNLLIAEIADMKHQMQEGSNKKAKKETSLEDPVVLRMALDKATESQRKFANALEKMRADYSEVVSKTDYDRLKKTHDALLIDFSQLQESKKLLTSQFEDLKAQLNETIAEKNELDHQYNELLETATPRAEWQICEKVIPGGSRAVERIFKDKTSKEKLHSLLFVSVNSYIGCRFLRSELSDLEPRGNISARDCLLLINEIWKQRSLELVKITQEAVAQEDATEEEDPLLASMSGPQVRSFDEFLADFFTANFPIELMRVEWANGFYDLLGIMVDVEEMAELRRVIDNEQDEACHWRFKMYLDQVKMQLYQLATVEAIAQTADGDHASPTRQKSLSGLEMTFKKLRQSLMDILYPGQEIQMSPIVEKLLVAAQAIGAIPDEQQAEQEMEGEENKPEPDPDLILIDLGVLFRKVDNFFCYSHQSWNDDDGVLPRVVAPL